MIQLTFGVRYLTKPSAVRDICLLPDWPATSSHTFLSPCSTRTATQLARHTALNYAYCRIHQQNARAALCCYTLPIYPLWWKTSKCHLCLLSLIKDALWEKNNNHYSTEVQWMSSTHREFFLKTSDIQKLMPWLQRSQICLQLPDGRNKNSRGGSTGGGEGGVQVQPQTIESCIASSTIQAQFLYRKLIH